MSTYHVYLTKLKSIFQCHRDHLWHDAAHQQLIVLNRTGWRERVSVPSHLTTNTQSVYYISLHEHDFGSVRGPYLTFPEPVARFLTIKLSLNRRFLAIQNSDIEIQVYDLHIMEPVGLFLCTKVKQGNRILPDGLIWNCHGNMKASDGNSGHAFDNFHSSQDLYIVTKLGIDHHRVSTKQFRTCKFMRSIAHETHMFWYNAQKSVIVLCSGEKRNLLRSFILEGSSAPIKAPKIVLSHSIQHQNLHCVVLYDTLYAVVVDALQQKLLLYSITRYSSTCIRSLNLFIAFESTPLDISVVDNILVCHCREFNVSLMYDVCAEAHQTDPYLSPLPIGIDQSSAFQDNGISPNAHKDERDNQQVSNVLVNSEGNGLGMDPEILARPGALDCNPARLSRMPSDSVICYSSTDMIGPTSCSPDGYMFDQWSFLPPDRMILISEMDNSATSDEFHHSVCIAQLTLHLREIAKCASQHTDLTAFLLRRQGTVRGKQFLLENLYNHILDQTALAFFDRNFAVIHDAYFKALIDRAKSSRVIHSTGYHTSPVIGRTKSRRQSSPPPPPSVRGNEHRSSSHLSADSLPPPPSLSDVYELRDVRNSLGFAVLLQKDFLERVWVPGRQDSRMSRSFLRAVQCEYIRSLHQHFIDVEPFTYEELFQNYAMDGKTHELQQLLHHSVPSDSRHVALQLTRIGCEKDYFPLWQHGMDMLLRLELHVEIVQKLLEKQMLHNAKTVTLQHREVLTVDAVSPKSFFLCTVAIAKHAQTQYPRSDAQDSAYSLFYSLYVFFRKWDARIIQCSHGDQLQFSFLSKLCEHRFPDFLFLHQTRTMSVCAGTDNNDGSTSNSDVAKELRQMFGFPDVTLRG